MRKLLMGIIAVLFVILGVVMATKGLQIGKLKIMSIAQVDDQNNNLKAKIEEVNTLIDTEYPKKIGELKVASNNMETAKQEYLKYTNLSTSSEILEAMQEKSYKIEFLWTKLGTHARQQGVVLKFEIVSSSAGANKVNDIKFTVDGTYTAITNFVYAIENDTDLNFRVENFKLVPYTSDIILEATFSVRNVVVEGNTSSRNTTNTTNNNSTNTNTTNDKNTNTNTNTTNDKNTNTNTTNDKNTNTNNTENNIENRETTSVEDDD